MSRPVLVTGTLIGLIVLLTLGTGTPAQAAAPDAEAPDDAPVELADQRTETTTSYRHPNGQITMVLATAPVRVRRDGEWVRIDLTLRRGEDGGVRPVATRYPVWLSGGGQHADAAAVRRPDGTVIALPWPTPLPEPRLAGNRATYPSARPGFDLVIEATRTGFVASLQAAATPVGAPAVPAPAGPAPAGAAAPLSLRITPAGGEPAVVQATELTTGPAGVLASSRVTDRVIAAAADPVALPFDTAVQSTVRHSDLSGDPELRVGSYDGAAVARSFLSWDLTALRGKQVDSATLRVHQNWSYSCEPRAWEVWSAGRPDHNSRWGNQPAAGRVWASSTETRGHSAACAPGWTSVDVTELVREWVHTGAADGTVMLRAADEKDPFGWKRFASGDSPAVPTLGVTLAR